MDLVELEKQLARRLSRLNVCVSSSGILQRVYLVDGHLDLLGADEVEEFAGVPLQISSLGDVAVHNGTHELDVLGAEAQNVDRVDSAGLWMLARLFSRVCCWAR